MGKHGNEYARPLGSSSFGAGGYNDVAPPELENGCSAAPENSSAWVDHPAASFKVVNTRMNFPSLESHRSYSRPRTSLLTLGLFLLAGSSFVAETQGSALEANAAPAAWADFVETNFPFFSSVLDARNLSDGLANDNLTPRGIILSLGNQCWACFDTDPLRMLAIWTGDGISPVSMSQVSYSLALKPRTDRNIFRRLSEHPDGEWHLSRWQGATLLSDPREAGPDKKEVGRGPLAPSAGQFKAVRLTQSGRCLEYEISGMSVSEWVEARLQ
jgi:hypothetical protein